MEGGRRGMKVYKENREKAKGKGKGWRDRIRHMSRFGGVCEKEQ